MQGVDPTSRTVDPSEFREFTGGGSRFSVGDTLMARITPCLENGKIARFRSDDAGPVGHGSTEFIVIRGREGVTDTDFAYYLTRWEEVRGYAVSQMTGTSGRQRVPTSALSHLEVPVPPLPEQRAIANILGTLDDKIELNRRMCQTLEGIARAIFQSWFVDFGPVQAKAAGAKRFRGMPQTVFDTLPAAFTDSPLGPIPTGWTVRPIGEVVDVVGGGTPSTEEPAYWEGGTHAFCTPKDMAGLTAPVLLKTERCLTDAGVARVSSGQLPPGTVLLSSRAPIGYLAIAEIPVSVNQGIIAMRCPREIPNLYVLLWAQANMDRIEANANGSTFQEISKRNFRSIPMLVPDRRCLAAFGGAVEAMYRRIVAAQKQNRSLAAIRDALLPKLVSGEIRIKDAERIVGRCA